MQSRGSASRKAARPGVSTPAPSSTAVPKELGQRAVTRHHDPRRQSMAVAMSGAASSMANTATAAGLERSSWTPLNHGPTNHQLFTERLTLLKNWFTNWSDGQRDICLSTLMPLFNTSQVSHVWQNMEKQPVERLDFTRELPRCISLYIFSFLDPRSLCRCSLVCWYWKMLCELDNLWAPKCQRFDWQLPYRPREFEQGAWKRLYVMKVESLRLAEAARKVAEEEAAARAAAKAARREAKKRPVLSQPSRPPLWRDPDPKPVDLEKFSRRIRTDKATLQENQLMEYRLATSQPIEAGQRASDANKLFMKSGPVDLMAISQPTKSSLSKSCMATPLLTTSNVAHSKLLATHKATKTTAGERLKMFKRTEKHRQSVVEALKKKQTTAAADLPVSAMVTPATDMKDTSVEEAAELRLLADTDTSVNVLVQTAIGNGN